MAINRLTEVKISDMLKKVNQTQKKTPFAIAEVEAILKLMEKDGLIMVSDDVIHPI